MFVKAGAFVLNMAQVTYVDVGRKGLVVHFASAQEGGVGQRLELGRENGEAVLAWLREHGQNPAPRHASVDVPFLRPRAAVAS